MKKLSFKDLQKFKVFLKLKKFKLFFNKYIT